MSKHIMRVIIAVGLLISIVGLGSMLGLTAAQTPPPPTTTTTEEFKELPVSITNKGVTFTVTSLQGDANGTNIFVTVANNSNVDVSFESSLTQLVAGTNQFKPTDFDCEAFCEPLHPGVTKSGVIKFPTLPAGTNLVKVYFKIWIGPELWEPVYTITIVWFKKSPTEGIWSISYEGAKQPSPK